MKLYLLTQNKSTGYDTYDSCLVAAETPSDARTIHPAGEAVGDYDPWKHSYSWAGNPKDVDCEFIGTAKRGTKRGIIISSFNAG